MEAPYSRHVGRVKARHCGQAGLAPWRRPSTRQSSLPRDVLVWRDCGGWSRRLSVTFSVPAKSKKPLAWYNPGAHSRWCS